MIKIRYMINLLAIGLVLIGLPGCTKQDSQPPAEQRWLHIYYDGEFEDSINVTGWEVNEDVVKINRYYYPWQGEDSIDYRYDEEGFLWVNGKLVAGSYSELAVQEDSSFNNILTLKADYYYFVHELTYPRPPLEITIEELERFPNLSLLEVDIQEWHGRASRIIDTLKLVPQDIDIYVSYGGSAEEYIRRLTGIRNLRRLYIYSRDLRNWDLMQLLGAKSLKKLNVKMEKKSLPWSIWILQFFLPYCNIILSVY